MFRFIHAILAVPATSTPLPAGLPAAMLANIDTLSDSDVDSEATLPLPGDGQLTCRRRGAEVFCGSAHLSNALQAVGFVMDKYDLARGGAEHDLTLDTVVNHLMSRVEQHDWDYVHFAPPCNTYSVARFPRIRSGSWLHMLVRTFPTLVNHDLLVVRGGARVKSCCPW
jgi:hypothetical protein